MQERRNSSALAMELSLSCTNPSTGPYHSCLYTGHADPTIDLYGRSSKEPIITGVRYTTQPYWTYLSMYLIMGSLVMSLTGKWTPWPWPFLLGLILNRTGGRWATLSGWGWRWRVTSHEHHGVSNYRRLNCLFKSLQQGNIKDPHVRPSVVSTGRQRIRLTKGQ